MHVRIPTLLLIYLKVEFISTRLLAGLNANVKKETLIFLVRKGNFYFYFFCITRLNKTKTANRKGQKKK